MKRHIILMLFVFSFVLGFGQDKYPFAEEIAKFEMLDKQQMPPKNPIVFVGSSSIRKWTELEKTYPGFPILNRGFGGSNFKDLIHYADQTMFKYKPSKIFIYEGDNDLAQGDSPELVFENLLKTMKMIRNELGDVPVVIISPKPSIARWKLKKEYETVNAYFEAYAGYHDNVEFVDVWSPLLDESGMVLQDIFVEDNLHMNDKGYAIWRKTIMPFLD
ncbi:MAG: hypothetical protein KDC49_13355 [Saprospiraceae bacterium]|nr:hypothetical protein [Saprospiraceae bacterium]